jgi:hypothetical protein
VAAGGFDGACPNERQKIVGVHDELQQPKLGGHGKLYRTLLNAVLGDGVHGSQEFLLLDHRAPDSSSTNSEIYSLVRP